MSHNGEEEVKETEDEEECHLADASLVQLVDAGLRPF